MCERNEKIDKIKIIGLILQTISIIGIFFGGYSVWIAKKGLVDQHEWNRRNFTLITIKDFNKDADLFRDKILKIFNRFHNLKGKDSKLTREEADTLYKANPGDSNYEDRKAISDALNYMEFISEACQARVVDEDIVYRSYGGLFIRTYEHVKEYIAVSKSVLGNNSYASIEAVVESWIQRRNKESDKERKDKDPTGK